MSYPVLKIEPIGTAYVQILDKAGTRTTGRMLDRAREPKGRKQLAADSGIDETYILEVAGIDTVKELRNRTPENLYARMVAVNTARSPVRALPVPNKVKDRVARAKGSAAHDEVLIRRQVTTIGRWRSLARCGS